MKRRTLLSAAVALPCAARAQSAIYPNKPIRLIPFGEPGGPLDILGRTFGTKMSDAWGQPVVVEAKPGAGGMIAADFVARAAPDGYTLLFTLTHTQLVLPYLQKVPYNPVKDFQPLTPVGAGGPVLMVRADNPANNIKDYVAWAKKKGRATCGTWGQGTAAHLYTELLKNQTDAPLEHIPYKSQGPAHVDLLSGVLDSAWANPATAKVHQQAGKVRILGLTGSRRIGVLPDVPTFTEQGYQGGFELDSWFGFLAPAHTPRPIVDQIVKKLHESAQAPDVRTRLLEMGLEPISSSPEEFAKSQERDLPRWGELIRASGVRGS